MNGLVLSETVHRGDASHGDHAHESPYFDMVLAGAHVERFDGGSFELTRSHVAYRPAGSRHANRVAPAGARCLNLELGRDWLAHHGLESHLPPRPRRFEDARLTSAMWRLSRELRSADAWSPLAMEGIAIEMVAQSARSDASRSSAPPWLATVEAMLRDSALAPPSLADLGQAAGVHPSHVARMVRRHHGCSVGELMRMMRLTAAVERIQGSAAPLSEIALDCGFYDQAHLTRVMRRRMGVTPGRLRRDAAGAVGPRTFAASKTGPRSVD